MASTTINILLSSFPGLGLPATLCIPVSTASTVADFIAILSQRIPNSVAAHRLILTTSSNKALSPTSTLQLSTLLPKNGACIIPLRLTTPLCGGKGGFGSQLRAAGGRMSSRKKRSASENNSSNRNLDGRRLRTVIEAKALAEYLAVKPEMEKKEKEERRKRWEHVVETAERKQEEIRSGKGKARVDGKWVEAKEEAEMKMREAVVAAMKNGALLVGSLAGPRTLTGETVLEDGDDGVGESESETDNDIDRESSKGTIPEPHTERKIYGWGDSSESE